jgi:hypothetical protein
MSKLKTMSAVLVAATTLTLASAGNAQAAIINSVSASTNMGGIGIANLTNNSGLSSNSLTATHADANPLFSPTNSWTSAVGTTTGNVDFNLGGMFNLAKMSVWNASGLAEDTGIKSVDIYTSQDNMTFSFLKNYVFTQGGNAAQSVALNAVASFVRFSIASNYVSGRFSPGVLSTGFSEAKFDGEKVPTPALLPGLAGMGIAAFRKRRDKAAKTVAA